MQTFMDLGGGAGWLGTLVIGLFAGWIADRVMGFNLGLIMTVVTGIIGAYVGAFLANALHIQLGEIFHGWFWGNLIVSAAGAIVLLFVIKVLRRA
jgi:uncharacterized membrane protein YeaQ/YmgE (transglycosylase-associated protein family)